MAGEIYLFKILEDKSFITYKYFEFSKYDRGYFVFDRMNRIVLREEFLKNEINTEEIRNDVVGKMAYEYLFRWNYPIFAEINIKYFDIEKRLNVFRVINNETEVEYHYFSDNIEFGEIKIYKHGAGIIDIKRLAIEGDKELREIINEAINEKIVQSGLGESFLITINHNSLSMNSKKNVNAIEVENKSFLEEEKKRALIALFITMVECRFSGNEFKEYSHYVRDKYKNIEWYKIEEYGIGKMRDILKEFEKDMKNLKLLWNDDGNELYNKLRLLLNKVEDYTHSHKFIPFKKSYNYRDYYGKIDFEKYLKLLNNITNFIHNSLSRQEEILYLVKNILNDIFLVYRDIKIEKREIFYNISDLMVTINRYYHEFDKIISILKEVDLNEHTLEEKKMIIKTMEKSPNNVLEKICGEIQDID